MREEAERVDLFRAEITKMFLAYNKPIVSQTIDAKAGLMNETLSSLPTGKITGFFRYVRSIEDSLPNDGTLKKILQASYRKFSNHEEPAQIEYKGEIPSVEWRSRFWKNIMLMIDKKKDIEEVREEMKL